MLQDRRVEPDLSQGKAQDPPGAQQFESDQKGARSLGDQRGRSSSCHAHLKTNDKQYIQHDIDAAAHDQVIERAL